MSGATCGTCGRVEDFDADSKSELRPYGAGGALICYRCAFGTPEAGQQAKRAFMALMDAASAPTGVASIGGNRGPDVFDPAAPALPVERAAGTEK